VQLTLALALQYESGAPLPQFLPLPASGKARSAQADIIDLQPVETARQLYEFSHKHGFFFLTYSLQGIPTPISENRSKLNLFV